MTFQQFIDKYKGKKIDFDGAFGAQCMDLYRFYVKEVWEKPQTPGVKGAFQVFDSLPVGYEKVKYKPGLIPKRGDVITWSESYTENGHIGIVVDATPKTFGVFAQNSPIGGACRLSTQSYKHIIGWFRPVTPMPTFPIKIRVKLVINGPAWATISQKCQEVRQWYLTHSQNKIDLEFVVSYSNFSSIPFHYLPNGSAIIDEAWFDANVLDISFPTTILIIRDEDFPDNMPGGLKQLARTLGYMGKVPTKTVIGAGENEMSEIYPTVGAFFDYVRHELMHSCYMWSGYYIPHLPPAQDEYFGYDYTHKYFHLPHYPEPGTANPEGAFSQLDYNNIINSLKKGQPMANQAKIVKSKKSPTVYICYPVPTETHLQERTSLEGITIPNPIPNTDSL